MKYLVGSLALAILILVNPVQASVQHFDISFHDRRDDSVLGSMSFDVDTDNLVAFVSDDYFNGTMVASIFNFEGSVLGNDLLFSSSYGSATQQFAYYEKDGELIQAFGMSAEDGKTGDSLSKWFFNK